MTTNSLKIALRLFWRQKFFSAISIAGLASGLAISLLIFLWVQREFSVDRFHANGERIYRIHTTGKDENGVLGTGGVVPFPLAATLRAEVPEFEDVVVTDFPEDRVLEAGDRQFREEGGYVSLSLFDVFSFPVIAGNLEEAKKQNNTILLSKSLAHKLYGENWQHKALGQTIRINGEDPFVVEAIYADMPAHSNLRYDYMLNIEFRAQKEPWIKEWGNYMFRTYALLRPGARQEGVDKKINQVFAANKTSVDAALLLQPFEEEYLFNRFENGYFSGGRIEYVRLFIGAGLFLLIIACINFVNLATARAARRSREVGVRKVVGAGKGNLFRQFMAEAGMITAASLLSAMLLAELLLPFASRITGVELSIDYRQPVLWLALACFFLLTTTLSGIYPSLVLSSFRPINALKGMQTSRWDDARLRKGLVVLQFGLSFLLIAGALVVRQQMNFIRHQNMGINRANIIYINMDPVFLSKYGTISEEISRQPGVAQVTATSHLPTNVQMTTVDVDWPGKPERYRSTGFNMLFAEYDFAETFEMELLEGRLFRPGASDSSSIIVNEAAARLIGSDKLFELPVTFWQSPVKIIGVVRDFHFQSLYNKVEPLVIINRPEFAWSMFIRTDPGETRMAIKSLESTVGKVLPGYQLEYSFLDEEYASMYAAEASMEQLADVFALLGVLIACLGLLGLASYSAQQRVREIGIRKVLGAGIGDILILLNREYAILLLIAFGLAAPGAFYLLNNWLNRFAYHTGLGWWPFTLAALLILLIAVLTVCFHSLRAAVANPAQSLKYE